MKSNSYRVILVSLLMIFSSLAGCLDGDDDADNNVGDVESLGTVMVSTYHVGELVKAIAGDHVTLDYMSQDNIPVHDYEPSAADLIRLQSADLFFYHGLGLEPWVDSTLEGLGDNAPTSIETHRMPSGEDTLNYEGMLVTELCELLTVGPYESTTLAMDEDNASEIHAEHTAHTLSFPEMDDDHGDEDHGDEDHGDEDHGDDDHGDDDHGDDDDHSDHGHATPEETIENPTGCPADTIISLFHLEEGEYVLEFEEGEFHDFNMAVLKMGGGHAHHDHGAHGDEHGEEHGDEHGDEMTAEHALEMFDTNNDSHLSWDEFWAGWMSQDDDHDDHDDHGDDHDDDEMVCYDMSTHTVDASLDNQADCEAAGLMWTAASGGSDHDDHDEHSHSVSVLYPNNTTAVFELDHDMLPENATGWDLTTLALQENNISLNSSTHAELGNMVHGINGIDAPSDSSWWWSLQIWNETSEAWEESTVGIDSVMMTHDDNDHIAWAASNADMTQLEEPGHHDDHDPLEEAMEEYIAGMLMDAFNGSDADGDSLLNMVELENFIESIDNMEDDFDSAGSEIMISVFDEDGDGQLSMSEFTSFMGAMDDGGDDHDDHDDHGDDHDDEEMVCYDMSTHTVNASYDNQTDCEAAGLMWTAVSGSDDHDDEEMMEMMFDMMDANSDGFIDASELDALMMEEDDHHAGHVTIHIEAEGDYGFALPHDVEFHIIMGEGGHDDHDDHSGHDDHDDHGDDHDDDEMVCYDMSTHTVDASHTTETDCEAAGLMWTAANSGPGGDDHGDEEDSHDDHGDEDGHDDHGAEEALNYDPHSWLDPMAFNTQLIVVMESLITAFPSAEADFRSNGDAYAAQLRDLDDAFDAAFGEGGVCMAGGHEKTVAANHNAYSYIAVRYDIQFVTVHGLDPEGEPSPEDVAEVVEHMSEEGINVLFVEEYTDQIAVQSIVDETDATVQILYTMEMAPSDSDDDYMSMMNKNLDNLVAGMGC